MNKYKIPSINSSLSILWLCLFMFLGTLTFAQGDLILLKKRVVFSSKDNIQKLDYGNTGNTSADYEVSLINMRMTAHGSFETITVPDSGQYFANDFIQYYPHSMVIQPNESQTMKIQLMNAATMKPGEYRSHLYFRAKEGSGGDNNSIAGDNESTPAKGMNVSVRTEFGIAIPVIVRIGESTTTVKLTGLNMVQNSKGAREMKFTIEREGNFSSYGHVRVLHIAQNGTETEVGNVMGVAVYTPGNLRHCSLQLNDPGKVDFKHGKLTIEYTQPKEEGGGILAKSELLL